MTLYISLKRELWYFNSSLYCILLYLTALYHMYLLHLTKSHCILPYLVTFYFYISLCYLMQFTNISLHFTITHYSLSNLTYLPHLTTVHKISQHFTMTTYLYNYYNVIQVIFFLTFDCCVYC